MKVTNQLDEMRALGARPSLFPEHLVGFMRGLAFGAAATAGAGAIGLAYGRFEAQHPVLRKLRVPVAARPGFTGLNVLHVSDLHMFQGQDFIESFLLDVVTNNQIDFVVSTGDNLGALDGLELLLDAYQPLFDIPGAFVLGSNDYYSPLTKSPLDYLRPNRHVDAANRVRRNIPDLPWLALVDSFTDAGWVDLTNQASSLIVDGQQIGLLGVDDPHIKRDRVPTPLPEWFSKDSLRIALTHAPYRRVLSEFESVGADIIYAGHTHGGQVCVPFAGPVITNCDIPRSQSKGLSKYGRSKLHVSAGLGTSPFARFRIACRPEATLMTIVPSDD
jgi:Predicted phosphohydrolases